MRTIWARNVARTEEVKCVQDLGGELTTLNEWETNIERDLKERRSQGVNCIQPVLDKDLRQAL